MNIYEKIFNGRVKYIYMHNLEGVDVDYDLIIYSNNESMHRKISIMQNNAHCIDTSYLNSLI